ncbi:MAG TPA: hypothetical protein VGZ28_02795 [Terriglobales bacterium]|nr:hypothetical protein [Terriglobales bacterium]
MLTLTSHVSLKNYAVDLSVLAKAPHVSKAELDYFLLPSRYVPTDGIVKETALKATAGATTEMEKARAIYGWWTTPSAIRRSAAAAAAIFGSCWSRAIWVENVPT